MPCPDVLGAFLNHCRRYTSLNFRDKIPIKLENTQCTSKTTLLFRETLGLSNQPAHTFPQNTVKILNIHRLHLTPLKITINNSNLFPNQPTISIPNFHQLTIIKLLNLKEAWKSIRVIVISIGEHLNSFVSTKAP